MICRIVSSSLILTFLLLAMVWSASAQTRTVGVSVGDTFTYSLTASWNSNDPSATVPSDLVSINETQWEKVSVTAVSGTNVTGTLTVHYRNGTEITGDGWVDVDAGDGNMTLFVSAGLVPGDSIYAGSDYSGDLINGTVSRTYQGGVRDTNHINMTAASSSSITGNVSVDTNLYWDKSTGVLVEFSFEESNQTGTYLTTLSEDTQISASSVWTVPEFSSSSLALLTLITLTSAIMVIPRIKRTKRSLP